jgi:apolipoprotein N-acyltransferase
MNFIKNKKNELLVLFAGCISVLAFAPFNHPYIIVLSILLLFLVINKFDNKLSKWRLLGYGYLYGLAFFNMQLYWVFYSLYKVIDAGFFVSLIALVGFTAFLASYIALTIYFYVRLKTKTALVNNIILFPSIWVLLEWIRGWFLGGFSWCEIGYTQVGNSFFRGFYPVLGNYGVSYLVLSLTGAVYVVVRARSLQITRSHVRLAILYCLLVFITGALIQNNLYTTSFGRPVKVAILQGNIQGGLKWTDHTNLDVYKVLVQQAQGDLILIPETAISQFEFNLPEGYMDNLTKIAKSKNADLILGIPKVINENNDYVNAAMLATNPKHPYYAKAHLVPYGEYIPLKWLLGPVYKGISLPMVGFSHGASYQEPLIAANQKFATNICYENGFNSELIKAAANATIMLNLSDMVWYGTTTAKDEHLQISQARALENQRYFIQATNTGMSAIIRPDGKVQAVLPVFERIILEDYVGGRIGITPFQRYGNWLIILWVSFMFVVILLYKLILSRRQLSTN